MDIENLINNQRSYFKKGHTKSIRFRLDQLEKLKDALKQNEALMFESIYADFKKSAFETFTTELGLLYNDINVAIKNTSKWANKKKVKSNLFNLPSRNYIIPEPLGVCLVIGAWNYPFQLSFAPVISAIAAGNTIILKPSEIASHSSNAIAKIVNENFPPEFFHVIEGGIKETGELLQQKFDKIFFTKLSFFLIK